MEKKKKLFYCSVSGCRNIKSNENNIQFFTFPRNIELVKKWSKFCRKDIKRGIICEKHFEESMMEKDLKQELLNGLNKFKLKPGAVPTKFQTDCQHSSRTLRCENRNMKKIVKTLLLDHESKEIQKIQMNDQILEEASEQLKMDKCTQTAAEENLVAEKEQKILELEKTIDQLRKENLHLQHSNSLLLKENEDLRKVHSKCGENPIEELTKMLHPTLTKKQCEMVLQKKKRVVWNEEDKIRGLSLRYLSKQSYLFLKKDLKYPLPSLSVLHKWTSYFQFTEGILHPVLKLMQAFGRNKTPCERTCVLLYDEVHVKTVYEYDVKYDRIFGPYSNMQVVMVRGIFDNYKQPIYIDFNKSMNGEILKSIIEALHNVGFAVVACVSDCGTGNQGVWRDLNVSDDNTFFQHPNTGENFLISLCAE